MMRALTMKTIVTATVFATVFIISARGQSFLNLNFESAYDLPANPPIPDGVDVPAANALSDWTAYDGSFALPDVNYVSNYISGVSTSVELEGGSLALSGTFSVGLYLDSSISQTAVVTANAESLQFEAQGPGAGGSLGASGFSVTLGGQNLSYSLLSVGPDYNVYGANIPADMDGQMEALIFGCQGIGSGQVRLDNIEFLTSSVPEPGEFGLICIGVVLFGAWRRRLTTKGT